MTGFDEDEESEYVAGDADRLPRDARTTRLQFERPEHPLWHALSVSERIAVVRWLQRGDAHSLLRALAGNPVSPLLRCAVAEGLIGGPETGWQLRIASRAAGGAPTKADKATLAALQTALAGYGGEIAETANRLAEIATGERARRGRRNHPTQAALVGIDLAMAYHRLGCWKQALYEVACFYGDSEKNIERLNTKFWKA